MSAPYLDKNLSYEERAKDLVSRMTLEEKCEQTVYHAPAIDRLGVKAYNYWNEALHGVARAGVATVFPQAIAMAATFDEDLVEKVADVISTEGRAKFNMQQEEGDYDIYKGLTFWSPNVNIFRDPRWGRGHETFGEDPYLTSRLGVRFINGLQGHDDTYMKSAACAKHFAVHSGPENVRHSFDAIATPQDMYETYLPAFEACVKEADVEVVMGAYNRTNGEPCCGSKSLLVDILRTDWNFQGHVTSDCWAIRDFHLHHKVTNTATESIAMAINNGCDLNCGNMYIHLMEAYNEGLVTEETITKSVERLFTTRMKLGMFDDSTPFDDISYEQVDCKEYQDLNLEVSKKSLVLLKNDNILPLNKKEINSIAVIGPNANSRNALVGNYEGTASRYITLSEGLQDYLGDDVKVRYSEGCHLYLEKMATLSKDHINDRLSEAKALAKISDVVVLCVGLDANIEGEEGDEGNQFSGGDKKGVELPGFQTQLIEEIMKLNENVIIVSIAGSSLSFGEGNNAKAIMQAFYPGALGGKAIAETLFGEFNPEGKLPVTFYNSTEELPDFTDYSMKNRTYRYMNFDPLYPFGFGLSYSKFELSDLKVNEDNLNIEVTVKNIGDIKGSEAIQIYVSADVEGAPISQLKKIGKVELLPNESKTLKFTLTDRDLSLYNEKGELVLNNCEYTIYASTAAPCKRSEDLGIKALEYKFTK